MYTYVMYLYNFPFIAPNHFYVSIFAWDWFLISRGIIHLSIYKCHLSSLSGIMFLLYAILWVLEVMLSLLRKAEGGERTVGLESPTSQRQLSNAAPNEAEDSATLLFPVTCRPQSARPSTYKCAQLRSCMWWMFSSSFSKRTIPCD